MKQKIKIMKHKPEPSDEEIRSYMDFERLMASKKLVSGTNELYGVLKRVVPVVAIAGMVVWFIFFSEINSEPATDPMHKESSPLPSVQEKIPSPNEPVQPQQNNEKQKPSTALKGPANAGEKVQEPLPLQRGLTEDVYAQAEPVAGYPSLYAYFNAQLVYPAESIKDSIQGVQTISFVINPEGRPEKIQVTQSLGEPFEKEARRLIENMPLWKPASLNGKPVPSQISLPLTFQIQKVKIKE